MRTIIIDRLVRICIVSVHELNDTRHVGCDANYGVEMVKHAHFVDFEPLY